ncbi:MAG: acetylglutamate kinase [Dehalococcoidia bacterium]|nr:acetylglutamate kinase [Dehalococcoidia bacterium]
MQLEQLAGKIIVVKIGGSTLGSHDTTLEDLVALQRGGARPVVVHGGGAMITQWLERHGIPTRFEKGLRVTDAASLEVVVAVLAGWVNTDIVTSIERLGGRCFGLSGADGRLLQARPKDPLLGYVGQVESVDPSVVLLALDGGYIPVIAPLGVDAAGQVYNINADTAAGHIASALEAEAMFFLTDVAGVCDREGTCLSTLDAAGIDVLVRQGTVSGGMIPKVEACLLALSGVRQARIVDGRQPHAVLDALGPAPNGTRIV